MCISHRTRERYVSIGVALRHRSEALCRGPWGRCKTHRLISRIKNKEFGILVTTSYVDKQAYDEIKTDGHNILIITARDIADILLRTGHNSTNVIGWLDGMDYSSGVEYIDSYL